MKLNLIKIYCCIFLTLAFSACNNNKTPQIVKYSGFTQGSTFQIKFYTSSDSLKIKKGIDSILSLVNYTLSIYDSNTIISKVNKNQYVELNEYFINLFNESQKISKITNGAFDITVGELVKSWGFNSNNDHFLTENEVNKLLKYVGYQKISIENKRLIKIFPEIKIDFNGIAQGYSIDLIANYLTNNACNNFIIEIGGEVRAKGVKANNEPWIVGIEKPVKNSTDNSVIQEKIILKNKSISTSGNSRKYFIKDGIKYSHIIDPKTGYPVKQSLISVSVIADNCTYADAYSTAFMVMELEKAKEFLKHHTEIGAYFIYTDSLNRNHIYCTNNFIK